MGSSSSKTRRTGVAGESTTSFCSSPSAASVSSSFVEDDGSRRKKNKSKRNKSKGFFVSSCLGSSSAAYDSAEEDDDDEVSRQIDEVCGTRIHRTDSETDEVKVECHRALKVDESDDIPCISSNVELGEWNNGNGPDNVIGDGGSSSQAVSGRSGNNSGRFLSRFSFVPGSVSFRLGRAASVGSSRAFPSSPTSFAMCRHDEDHNLRRGFPCELINRNENQHRTNLTTPSLRSASVRSHNGDHSSSLLSSSVQGAQRDSVRDFVDNMSERTRSHAYVPPVASHTHMECFNRRLGDRRNDTREPVEPNVRFSRTLSVGRLRDRVLRRSSFSDLTLSPLQRERTGPSNENPADSLVSSPYPLRSIPNSYSSQNNNAGTPRPRETSHHDLLEHRSNFMERRRRIRSQVRALQRLGNRFDNFSGHERYCILSGQHRTGHCSCRLGTRENNSSDDGGTRASISRIVMLAEALFEVLDEIHQQSVVLSSRPSVSSIGSVPAPTEAVEALPLKVFSKSTKSQSEEVAQCYICLVEYEEGDSMRILPCHHEFHKKCIDKWLKEIHRVCPLCRGDVCRSDSLSIES